MSKILNFGKNRPEKAVGEYGVKQRGEIIKPLTPPFAKLLSVACT
jgi:hypothetical protein